MKRLALIGTLLMSASAVVPGEQVAAAADGRIHFSGAVVSPTCMPRIASADPAVGRQHPLRCADPASSPGGRVSSRPVDVHSAAGNPLLNYYLQSRVSQPGTPVPRLVTVDYQ